MKIFNIKEKTEIGNGDKILEELKNFKSSENGKFFEFNKVNLEKFIFNENNLENLDNLISNDFNKFKRLFFIGENIDYFILKNFLKLEEKPYLIIFDAYANCKSNSFLDKLINERIFNIVLISTRNLDKDEFYFISKNNINWIKMDILREDLEGVCDIIMEKSRESSGFFIILNMNSIDPGFAPGVNNLEVGGLTSNDIIYFIKRLSLLNNFKGSIIKGIYSKKDINNMTIKLSAKLLVEMS